MTTTGYILPTADLLKNSASLQNLIRSDKFRNCRMRLPIIVGSDEDDKPVIADLADMPHLLIGGNKAEASEYLDTLILSLLFKNTPEELKLVILDPRKELTHFAPLKEHFLAFAPHEPENCVNSLRQRLKAIAGVQEEMNRRYQTLLDAKAHSLKEYNTRQEATGKERMPYIVMIVNDYQDLAAIFDKRVEFPIAAIAQKGRAVGIHIVLRTRDLSTSVITGILKANFPGRLSFSTEKSVKYPECSKVDCKNVVAYISAQTAGRQPYLLPDVELPENISSRNAEADPLLSYAVDYATSVPELSIPMIQRRYTVGYNRATRLMDMLAEIGVVASEARNGKHKVLIEPKDIKRILCSHF